MLLASPKDVFEKLAARRVVPDVSYLVQNEGHYGTDEDFIQACKDVADYAVETVELLLEVQKWVKAQRALGTQA